MADMICCSSLWDSAAHICMIDWTSALCFAMYCIMGLRELALNAFARPAPHSSIDSKFLLSLRRTLAVQLKPQNGMLLTQRIQSYQDIHLNGTPVHNCSLTALHAKDGRLGQAGGDCHDQTGANKVWEALFLSMHCNNNLYVNPASETLPALVYHLKTPSLPLEYVTIILVSWPVDELGY